jgi:hypothetical protein
MPWSAAGLLGPPFDDPKDQKVSGDLSFIDMTETAASQEVAAFVQLGDPATPFDVVRAFAQM